MSLNAPTHALVGGQQANHELLGRRLQQIDACRVMLPLVSSMTTTENGCTLVLEERDQRDRLAVVEHVEVFLHQIRHEPLLASVDRHVERHDLRAGFEGRSLREQDGRGRDGEGEPPASREVRRASCLR